MGVSVWVRLRQPIPGIDPLQVDGKLLAKAMDVLDAASARLKVHRLSDFYSVSKKQALAELDGQDLTDEEWQALADDHVWWPAPEGLATVAALLEWASANPGKLHRPEDVVADLRGFHEVLSAAVRANVEFNVAVDA